MQRPRFTKFPELPFETIESPFVHGYPSYPIAFEETVSEDPRTGIITEMIEAFPYDPNKDEDENENGETEET